MDTFTSSGHVLNADEMAQIWADIEHLISPSWTTSVPLKLGTASHGKLKADQWRALGTIHLPVSLIRLWGIVESSEPRLSRCLQILNLTISLASAVVIATSHTVTTAHAEAYLQYMLQYLKGMKELFPEYKLHPNHHMALHIHEFLLLFGPVHSWWTFPFERMIGALQRMPHNDKIGPFNLFKYSSSLILFFRRTGRKHCSRVHTLSQPSCYTTKIKLSRGHLSFGNHVPEAY